MHPAPARVIHDPGLSKARAEQWARRDVSKVVIDLPHPPSLNSLWRRGRKGMIRSPRYETWFQAAGLELNAQRPGAVHGPYALRLEVGRPDRRKRDLDNAGLKAISDLLQHHKVIDDDSLASKITLEWSSSIPGARVTIEAAA